MDIGCNVRFDVHWIDNDIGQKISPDPHSDERADYNNGFEQQGGLGRNMRTTRTLWLFVVVALVALMPNAFGQAMHSGSRCGAEVKSPAKGEPITKGLRVFTAGNSFHAWFIAPILKDMALGAGIEGHEIVGESKIGGSEAIQHWNVPDDQNKAKAALSAGSVDVLTLACMLHPDDGIAKFAEFGLAHNPDFRISLQEFWIPWDKFEWPYKGREEDVNPDAATVAFLRDLHAPYFKEMDAYVKALNARLGKQVVSVAPVGQAILDLRGRIIAGKMPGIAKQSELFTDKLGHPQPPLQTLVAYVHFAVLYQRTPVGLPMPAVLKEAHKPQWDDKLNRTLQEIAWKAVLHHPLSGVKGR
ncbi:MAG: hypothetical protein JWL77_4586 [Chthonomonadaceae bacterium]|nr:hypothetical protein [Chthonomonadaceae bacterium]